jgi:2-methylisocitrate lyase-like PEP mutase family enzyme
VEEEKLMGVCQALRQALQSGEPVVAPLCYDPLTSKLVERLGFPAAYLGGGALGFVLNVTEAMLTLTELVAVLRQITLKTTTPIIVDGTTGFGEPLHVMRTVHEVERCGGAGIEIEDQLVPKRAHHHKGIEHLIPTEAMVDKVRAAVEAREDPDFLIIARTNAIRQVSLAEAVKRGNAYAEAGADMIMAFPRTPEEARQLPKEIRKPVVYMLSAVGERPPFTPQELYAMGYPLIIESQAGLMIAYGAIRKAYLELKEKARISGDPAEIKAIRDEINEVVDLPRYWALEARTVEKNRAE